MKKLMEIYEWTKIIVAIGLLLCIAINIMTVWLNYINGIDASVYDVYKLISLCFGFYATNDLISKDKTT